MQLIGPYGGLSEEHIGAFRASEANTVWFHGFADELFDRCTKAGAAPCVEFRTFRANYDEHPELVPIGVDGEPIRRGRLFQGVCLSQHEFLEEREAELRSGMNSYAPAGVWLDYLTYAGWFETPEPDLQESCFCPDCIREFRDATGVDAAEPREILRHHADLWRDHKCDRIVYFARRFASIVRGARPETIVGLYACPWYPNEYEGALTRIFAQDLGRLAEEVDVITPLLYATKSARSPDWVTDYMAGCREFVPQSARVEPILDALDLPGNLNAIAAAGEDETVALPAGFQVFGGDSMFSVAETTALFDRAARVVFDR